MKLTKAEKMILMLTLLVLVFVLGVHLGTRRSRDNFTIQTQPRTEHTLQESTDGAVNSAKVNINTADKETLQTLPGIGEVLAERILDYRRTHGTFASIDEITRVEGIGNGIFSRICTLITTG